MAVTTTINLVAGGSTDEIVVEDQNGNNLPVANITWGPVSDPNVTITPAADGIGFVFAASAAAPTETLGVTATYNGPGNPNPVVSPTLNVIVTAAAPSVTALQFNEISGA
jgi:hypothetical protein